LRGRLDPSDVLQETFLSAFQQLGNFLDHPAPPPFSLWLRGLVLNRLDKLHRLHLGATKRDARRDVSLGAVVSECSSAVLAAHLVSRLDQPSKEAHLAELQASLTQALDQLDPLDREALLLRHFEQLTSAEAGQVLGISEAAAGKRYLRALERLRQVVAQSPGGLDALARWFVFIFPQPVLQFFTGFPVRHFRVWSN
jgi:RNA polymerase sigma-70 factor (ECF subfamily)